ncbi:MAG TPA: hypothetical protein VFM10_13500 [Terriglobales bacterium]|jgi:hypothetical protein|nr:hypothetical protein [Terriglobales bacterium]
MNDRLVVWIGNLAVKVFNPVDQCTYHLLTVCAGVVTTIARIARALALDERQHFRTLPLIAFDVQHIQPISVTGI